MTAVGHVTLTKRDASGNILFQTNGASISKLETTDLALGHTRDHKYVDAVRLELTDSIDPSTFQLFIGHRDKLDDATPIVWNGPFTLEDGFEFNFDRIDAVFYRLRILSNGANSYWLISAIEFWGDISGGKKEDE